MTRYLLVALLAMLFITSCSGPDPGTINETAAKADSLLTNAELVTEVNNLKVEVRKMKADISLLKKEQDGNLIGTLLSYLLIAGVGIGAYLGYRKYGKRSKSADSTEPWKPEDSSVRNNKSRERKKDVGDPDKHSSIPPPGNHERDAKERNVAEKSSEAVSQEWTVSPVTTPPPVREPVVVPATPLPPPVYATSPVSGVFIHNRLEDRPGTFTYFMIQPSGNGQTATYGLTENTNAHRQIIDSQAAHSEAIDFTGRATGGGSIAETTAGVLKRTDQGWKIMQRMVLTLR